MSALLAVSKVFPVFLQGLPDSGGLTPDQRTQIALEALKHPEGGIPGAIGVLVPFAFFATIILIFWLLMRHRQARMQARAEFHKQLLDKFSSGREFSDFLQTDGSQRFLEEIWSQKRGPREQILSSLRYGIVLAALGLGMLALTLKTRGFIFPAVLTLALGVGFLISTAVARRLSKQWDNDSGAEHA